MILLRCARLGLVALAYLWRRDQGELLQEMIDCHIEAIVIKVAALGLDPSKHLGMTIADLHPHIVKMVNYTFQYFYTAQFETSIFLVLVCDFFRIGHVCIEGFKGRNPEGVFP